MTSPPSAKRIQRQQHGGGIVVDDNGGNVRCCATILTCERLMQQLAKQAINVDIALASLPGVEIELQIGICRGSLSHMLQRGSRQRGASQVGVKDDSGCIDDRTKRVTRRLPHLALDRSRNSGKGQVEAPASSRAAAISLRRRPRTSRAASATVACPSRSTAAASSGLAATHRRTEACGRDRFWKRRPPVTIIPSASGRKPKLEPAMWARASSLVRQLHERLRCPQIKVKGGGRRAPAPH